MSEQKDGLTTSSISETLISDNDQSFKSQYLKHSELLTNLLKYVKPVDFRKLAKLLEGEKLTVRHYVVFVVKEIIRLAQSMNWNICHHNNHVYLYNGAYWAKIEDELLKRFLGLAAKKMGWDQSFSDHFKYRDDLFKQFMNAAYLPALQSNNRKVLINLQNGTFEITNKGTKLREFDPRDFLTYQLPFTYDPDAKAPTFQKYIERVLPDKTLQNVLSEYAGYVFIPTASLKLEKVLMLYGTGANGKSVFFDILRALVGNQNFSTYTLQSLTNESGYHRHELGNRLVNYASEISGRIETSYFKTLASGEPIEARLPYRNPVIIRNYAKLIFNVNILPQDVEHTEGFYRRFIIIPFKVKIPEHERDLNLADKIIQNELPGVFNWVLSGLYRLLEQGNFTHSEVIANEIETYRQESDSVALFMKDNHYFKSLEQHVPQKDLYSAYRGYSKENGYKPVTYIGFGKRLENLGFIREVNSAGRIVYVEKPDDISLVHYSME